ncbi:MAG: peptide ABC transporter substrate-binding protein [Opitutaceae bacterium]
MSGWSPRIGAAAQVGAGLLLALAAGCERAPTPPAESVLRVSQRNEPASLDPATTTLADEFGMLRALLEGLLVPGPAGEPPRPGAAVGFEVSADGRTYVFHLRPDGRWSDGAAVTATQFIAAYERALRPATASPQAAAFHAVAGARAYGNGHLTDFGAVGFRALDPQRLEIRLEQPNPRFPHHVVSGPWLPVRADVVARHGRRWTEPAHFVGNGPFLLSEWLPDQRVVLRRNPTWHGAAGVALTAIQFVRFDSGDSEERAYRAGQLEATMAVPGGRLAAWERERPAELRRAPMLETRYLAFNTRRPALTAGVRPALALALDRERLAPTVLQGGPPAAARFLPPGLAPAAPPTGGGVRFDAAAAREELARAGFPGGRGLPRLELSGWTQTPVLEAIQELWRRELGVETAIAVREARVHLDALRQGTFDLAFITAIPDAADPLALLESFGTGHPLNYPGWSDPAYGRWLAAAGATADPAQRDAHIAAAEGALLAACPLTPLYFNTKIWLLSPRVQGWEEDGLWGRTYQGLRLLPP